jgi:hypothetical protein
VAAAAAVRGAVREHARKLSNVVHSLAQVSLSAQLSGDNEVPQSTFEELEQRVNQIPEAILPSQRQEVQKPLFQLRTKKKNKRR